MKRRALCESSSSSSRAAVGAAPKHARCGFEITSRWPGATGYRSGTRRRLWVSASGAGVSFGWQKTQPSTGSVSIGSPAGRPGSAAAGSPTKPSPAAATKAVAAVGGSTATSVVDDRVAASVLGRDHHTALGLLTLALGAQIGVLGQGGVYHPALVRLHRLEPDALLVPLRSVGHSQGQLSNGVLAPGSVTLHVDDDGAGVREVLTNHGVDQQLHRAQGLAPPADQQAQAVAPDVDDGGARVG